MAGTQDALAVGDLVELEADRIAHGGHVVGRAPNGQVVFVRHALPGERVTVRVTEAGARFVRADAVAVHEASPYRVAPPCPLAHPDGCGGCDFQHVALDEQRRLKAAVVREQLQRLAGIDCAVEVEAVPVPGRPDDGLGWRTRMQYVTPPDDHNGAKGLRKHRSHEVVVVRRCLIAAPGAREPGPGTVEEPVLGRSFTVTSDGFWQVHPEAPRVLVETVLDQLRPQPGERVVDLYAGVGLFAAFLAGAVGEQGSAVAVEGDRTAARHAEGNLADLPQAEVVADRVDRWLQRETRRRRPVQADLLVLDPPRTGARRAVVDRVAAVGPRAVAYVACDPAALARDLGYFADRGYRLSRLRALDLFPMTHHVECVALLEKTASDLGRSESA
ncbi:MAG: class I SAM-dependent RNA methyltransferase [Marmoricola sp.]